jgi:ankyrin repeat protein
MKSLNNDTKQNVVQTCNLTQCYNYMSVSKHDYSITKPIFNHKLKLVRDNRHKHKLMKKYIYDNDIIGIKYLIHLGVTCYDSFMKCAIKNNNKKLVKFFINKGVKDNFTRKQFNFNFNMLTATIVNNKELVNLFIDYGANSWAWGMALATQNNNKELVDMFIRKGDDDNDNNFTWNTNCWDWGMSCAVENNHTELVEFFISKGATNIIHL